MYNTFPVYLTYMSLKKTINTLTFPNVILVTKSSRDYVLKYLFRTEDLQMFTTT
jgi:hypothetical protein